MRLNPYTLICVVAAVITISIFAYHTLLSSTHFSVTVGETRDKIGVTISLLNSSHQNLHIEYHGEVQKESIKHNLSDSNYIDSYVFRGTSYRLIVVLKNSKRYNKGLVAHVTIKRGRT